MKNQRGVADHAPKRKRWWNSLPFRTFIQGLATDVGIVVCLALVELASSDHVDWWVWLITLGKTVLMTAASYIMKRLKPPSSQ